MFFEVKKSPFSSRFFSQIAPLSSLEEAVEPEVFHSQTFKQTNQNSFLKTFRDVVGDGLDETLTGLDAGPGDVRGQAEALWMTGVEERMVGGNRLD